MARLHLLLACALAAQACTYTVRMLSVPTGALITFPDGSKQVAPAEVELRRKAAGHLWVTIEAAGYRTLQVDMQRTEGQLGRYVGAALFQKGGREVTFVLEPEHGPAGSAAPP